MFNSNETMTLGRARILSSENDASVSQSTNVNIRIARSQPTIPQPSTQAPSSVNFTQPLSEHQARQSPQMEMTSPSQFVQDRGIVDMVNDLDDLTIKNKFLETLLSIYEMNSSM